MSVSSNGPGQGNIDMLSERDTEKRVNHLREVIPEWMDDGLGGSDMSEACGSGSAEGVSTCTREGLGFSSRLRS